MAALPEALRRRRGLVAAVLAAAALIAHALYWYGGRERAVRPAADVPWALFSSQELPSAVWVAYPHQNLAALAGAVGDPEGWLGSVARLLGGDAPKVPGFGPFRAPPARELCVATDPATHRLVGVARVFPAIAALARLAGMVASNPWLAGGDVTLSGRPAQVGWHGTLWWVATDPTLVPEAAAPPSEVDAALARVRLASPQAGVPSGTYTLARSDGGLELASGARLGPTAWPAFGEVEPLLFVAASGQEAGLERGGYLLWPSGGELALPGLAAFRVPGSRAWRLPGGGAADLLGGVRDRAADGGWTVSALDSRAAERALAFAPELARWMEPGRPGAPTLALRIDLGGTTAELHRLNRALAAVPLLSRKETERWLDAERALRPLVRFGQLELLVTAQPAGARLRLGGDARN